jgi:hypothetical protein
MWNERKERQNEGRTKRRKEGKNGTLPAMLGRLWTAHAFRCQNINDKLLHLLFQNPFVFLSRETLHAKVAIRVVDHESDDTDGFLSGTSFPVAHLNPPAM